MYESEPGDTITLTVVRNQTEKTLTVVVGKRPDEMFLHYLHALEEEKATRPAHRFDEEVVPGLEEMDTHNLVALYLREGGRHELLTREEEYELASAWQAARHARDRLEREGDTLSDEERAKLEEIIRKGNAARQDLIKANLPRVWRATFGLDSGRQHGLDACHRQVRS